jgi:hypothetical protein
LNDLARGEVPSWKEYSLENKEVQDWVVWEALTHESVLRSKDDSVLGVIRYKPFQRKEGAGISLPAFSQGWVMNIEEQHGEEGESCFLTLTWNPFLSLKGDKVENALGENTAMTLDAMEQHMFSVLDTLASRFPPEAEAKILKYQEIIDYLAFSLSHGRMYVEMPDVPVDLDVYLTQDFTADFSKNLITFGEETFLILTLPAFLGAMEKTLRRIIEEMEHAHIPCRHVQRILFFDEKEARKEMERRDRMGLWCRSRKYIKELIEAPLHGKFYGYYNNTLVALVKTEDYGRTVAYLRKLFYETQEFYVIENFNAKQRWWGTIPAHFRAGVAAPICAFQSLEDLLMASGSEKKKETETLVSVDEDESGREEAHVPT